VMAVVTALCGLYLMTRRTFRDLPVTTPAEPLPAVRDG
jgi:hypothetical protein